MLCKNTQSKEEQLHIIYEHIPVVLVLGRCMLPGGAAVALSVMKEVVIGQQEQRK
jgi:hypothetical protein